MARILVVDDDAQICSVFSQFLSEQGHASHIAGNADDALKSVVEFRPDLVLMDIRMPGTDGLAALAQIREVDPDVYVVIMTAYGTSQTSIEAMRLGAFDYLMKPLDLDVVASVIDRAIESLEVSRGVERQRQDEQEYSLVNLVGNSAPMQQVYKLIGLLAANDVPALLIGERGVGKQLVAKTIHFNSSRKHGPFVVVACRGVASAILEAELFGDGPAPGSTPLPPGSAGRIAAASTGTLFLADVDALPPRLQGRLLALLTGEADTASGDGAAATKSPRILAATERSSRELVREAGFNEELAHVLGTLVIEQPPLRRRVEDIPDLVEHFITRCNVELSREIKGADQRVAQMFRNHTWPGNVSELETVIRRAAVLARGDVITAADIGDLQEPAFPRSDETRSALDVATRRALRQRLAASGPDPGPSHFHELVRQVEQTLVHEALAVTSGNQLRAAELLGLNRTTLRKKMQR